MTNEDHCLAAVILAAGLGTRMKSERAKVLHQVAGRPMVTYVVEVAARVAGRDVVLVIGNQADRVRRTLQKTHEVFFALQESQQGTGHAVQCALPFLPARARQVLILCGDVPLLRPATIERFVSGHCSTDRDLSLLAMEAEDPTGYGRVLQDAAGVPVGIVEQADADPRQRALKLVNTGIYCVKRDFLATALQKIRADNTQGEIYLTDLVAIGHREGRVLGLTLAEDCEEFIGVNTPAELATVDRIMRRRLRKTA